METTYKLAAFLIPLIFIAAVLRFVHEAMLPLVLPLLLLAAGALLWKVLGNRPPTPPSPPSD
jgi:hypothetical protein